MSEPRSMFQFLRRFDVFMRSLCCSLLGHCWESVPMRYQVGTTYAYGGNERHRRHLIPVTWVTDERCSWCGIESSWPA